MSSASQIGRQRGSFCPMSVLSFAVLEWLLMFFLFINAFFSYLVMRFARLCKLQTPCLVCSRLDHVFENEKPGFYRKLICESHKLEISSLAYCYVHRNLADVSEMCEGCLLSFATEKRSNPETFRSLMGKLGTNHDNSIDCGGFENKLNGDDAAGVPLLKEDTETGSLVMQSVMHQCSCCSVLFKNKSSAVSSLHNNFTEESCLHDQDRLSKKLKNSLGSASSFHLELDHLSHIGYNEVKAISDSELDNQLSDNDDKKSLGKDVKEDLADRCLKPEPVDNTNFSMPLSDDISLEKSINGDYASSASIVAIGHDSEENKWSTREEKVDPPALSETVSEKVSSEFLNGDLDNAKNFGTASISTTYADDHIKPLSSRQTNENTSQVTSDQGISVSMSMDLNDAYKLAIGSKGRLTPPTVAEVITGSESSTTSGDEPLNLAETNENTSRGTSDPGVSGSMQMDLNDAYKLAIGSKHSLTTPTVAEVITGRGSSKVYEDLKVLISRFSTSQGLESPWIELIPSPRLHVLADDKLSDTSILQNITKRLSIERNESGFESLDGSIVSEIEGESAVDRLKRQVEMDRKSIYLLYKELEEERNASAIAANQTMAMITRLQQEKAEMHMEALQYQRMMEQQAEFDQEALQRLNELLAQREKEIQELAAEVESYSKRIDDEIIS